MMDIKHKFNEPVVKERRLLKLFALSRSQLYKMIHDWNKKGGDPKDMGKLPRLAKQNLWAPQVFLQWELKHIINRKPNEGISINEVKKQNKSNRTIFISNTNQYERKSL
jgi:transposase|tara:strand:+ start:1921 stop:2247 length:327 start_codon:yes stop_codon:yes gene_type:complete